MLVNEFSPFIIIISILSICMICVGMALYSLRRKKWKTSSLYPKEFQRSLLFQFQSQKARSQLYEFHKKQVSAELMDNIGQMLSLIKLKLDNVNEGCESLNEITLSKAYLTDVIKDVRSLSKRINQENPFLHLDFRRDFQSELEQLTRDSPVKTYFRRAGFDFLLNPYTQIIVLNILQQLILRYASFKTAKNLIMSLQNADERYILVLSESRNDTLNFSTEKNTHEVSFVEMDTLRKKADLFDGEIEVTQTKGQPFYFKLIIPINRSINHDYSRTG